MIDSERALLIAKEPKAIDSITEKKQREKEHIGWGDTKIYLSAVCSFEKNISKLDKFKKGGKKND